MVHIDTRQLTCRELWDYILKDIELQEKILCTLCQIMEDKKVTGNGKPEYWVDKKKVISDYFSDICLEVVDLSYRPYGIKVVCKDSKFLMYCKTAGNSVSLVAKKVGK